MIGSIISIIIFFVIWALLHSVLAARPVKVWARRTVGAQTAVRWYRLVYNVVSTLTVLPLFILLAWLPDQTLYVAPAPLRWLMVAGQLLALGGLVATLMQTDVWHFVGLAQLIRDNPTEEPLSLQVDGFYGWVRHPLYTLSLLLIWLTPVMTINLLTTFIVFTLYFYVGSIHEERRLLAKFGDAYRTYQENVPRLVPRIPSTYRSNPDTT